MARIKQVPEDFVVREVFEKQKAMSEKKEIGYYTWFNLKKTNWDTFRALNVLSRILGVSIKRFGYAGVKDKRAVTYQKVSVWNVPADELKKIELKDIELSGFEEKKERINLGDLKGNEFRIVIRDIGIKEKSKIEKNLERLVKEGFLNCFGPQRFGFRNNTHLVGREILNNRLKEAVWIYLTHEGDENEEARKFRENLRKTGDYRTGLKECPRNLRNEIVLMNHLVKKENDYAGALRRIPKKFRTMFVHAYQSYLWNKTAEVSEEGMLPIIGFETRLDKYKTIKQIERILKGEDVKISDFRIKSMPELSSMGSERQRVVDMKEAKWEFGEDELNVNRLKCILGFVIPKGSYATTLIDMVIG